MKQNLFLFACLGSALGTYISNEPKRMRISPKEHRLAQPDIIPKPDPRVVHIVTPTGSDTSEDYSTSSEMEEFFTRMVSLPPHRFEAVIDNYLETSPVSMDLLEQFLEVTKARLAKGTDSPTVKQKVLAAVAQLNAREKEMQKISAQLAEAIQYSDLVENNWESFAQMVQSEWFKRADRFVEVDLIDPPYYGAIVSLIHEAPQMDVVNAQALFDVALAMSDPQTELSLLTRDTRLAWDMIVEPAQKRVLHLEKQALQAQI